jgi:glycosyltransferase involved in cell wall biosynthesis
VVVDSGSTDGTQAIAERLGARVVFNAWPGFGQQKRFAETQCANNWLLNLDADEVVSLALAQEIEKLFANGEPPLSVYALKIKDIYPGQTKPRPWADDYRPPRLYDRRVVQFKDSTLHDSLDVRGRRVGLLRGAVHHFSVRSLDDHVRKGLERARYNAEHAKPKSRMLLRARIVTEFPFAFLRYYIGRRHFMGGLIGFQISMSAAFARFVRVMLMLERAQQTSPTENRLAPPKN